MSSEDSLKSRQNNEFEALKAIYGDDLKDLRKKRAWNAWCPLNLSISLVPTQSNSGKYKEICATLDLHIICSETYPNEIPTIKLENFKGLSNSLLEQLKNDLERKANELKGEEMIFQLCQCVQEFLLLNNKPASKSFYDQMLQRQKEEELKDREAKQIEIDRQRQITMEEIEYQESTERKAEDIFKKQNSSETDSDFIQGSSSTDNLEWAEESICEHKGTVIIKFDNPKPREIHRGECLKHTNNLCTVFTGIDKESGEIVLVNEWKIEIQSDEHLTQVIKQFSNLEMEFKSLLNLKHKNLVRYLGIKSVNLKTIFIIYILREFIYGMTCSSFVNNSINLDYEYMKKIAKSVLDALSYLHRNNVVHKNIKQSNVYVHNNGRIVLSNYSLYQRLHDLSLSTPGSVKYSKKTDIYQFGVFVSSLIKASSSFEVGHSLPQDLQDFLHKCSLKEKEHYTADQLLSHEFFEKNLYLPAKPIHEGPDTTLTSRQHTFNQSRIETEFEILQELGKGAYGNVLQAKNKLDNRLYAIKRIKLNPKNRQLNKKVVREVEVFSRCNHEHVVRYYNSWIETATMKDDDHDDDDDDDDSNNDVTATVPETANDKNKKSTVTASFDSLLYLNKTPVGLPDDAIDNEKDEGEDESDDEDDSNAENNWELDPEDDDSIQFVDGSVDSDFKKLSIEKSLPKEKIINFLYIQMEYCEKLTLRTAIDNNLYQDENRVSRMIREIIDGLAYIHEQKIIHRDLKPVNIFLDYADNVKIGDFGLATINIKSKNGTGFMNKNPDKHEELNDEKKTGLIGTALYAAPELNVGTKANYNKKVDIYSLGIILFEMCYQPMTTGMERIKVLNGIRLKEIIFPKDFNMKKKKNLIRSLLNHDVSKRPTCAELLNSQDIPPPASKERIFRELVPYTLNNPQLTTYNFLIASCFNQLFTVAQNIMYEKKNISVHSFKQLNLYDFVKENITKIFKQHGGQNISTTLLLHKNNVYDIAENCVKLMTNFGAIVSLPHDLRISFARYIAWNSITVCKRYCIEKVYREEKIFGTYHAPKELYECAFDIVTPTSGNLIADAEILSIVYEIIKTLPGVRNQVFTIRLNHLELLNAILLHFGVRKEHHKELYPLLAGWKDGKLNKHYETKLNTRLTDFGVKNTKPLFSNLDLQFEVTKASTYLHFLKLSSEAADLGKQAIQDLKIIIQNAETFGVNCKFSISTSLLYKVNQYSGMICQFVYEVKKQDKNNNIEVIAAGGRYDSTIDYYRSLMGPACAIKEDCRQSAVGISISVDKLVQIVQKHASTLPKLQYLDLVICSIKNKPMLKELIKIMNILLAGGIKCSLFEEQGMDEIKQHCNALGVSCIISLKEKDPTCVIIEYWEKDRLQWKTLKLDSEFVENVLRIIKNKYEGSLESPSLTRSDSKTFSNIERNEQSIGIIFLDKLTPANRKRCEGQIGTQLDGLFKRLTVYINVLCLDIDINVTKTIASNLDCNSVEQYKKSVISVIEKHPRHKKYIDEVCEKIYEHKTKRTNPLIILYSAKDYDYQLLI